MHLTSGSHCQRGPEKEGSYSRGQKIAAPSRKRLVLWRCHLLKQATDNCNTMTRKRGRPKKVKEESPDVHASSASKLDANGSKKEDIDDGSNLTCPKCSRVFTSSLGLKYHTGKFVGVGNNLAL